MKLSSFAFLLSAVALGACASSTPTGVPSQQSDPSQPGPVDSAPPSTELSPNHDAGAGGTTSGSSSGSSGASSSGSSGSSSSGGPPPPPPPPTVTEQCTPIGGGCAVGGDMEYCITYTGGVCSKIVYKHAGKTYACNSGAGCGGDCTPAYYQAYTACQDAVGACNDLAGCCNVIADAYYPSCAQTYNSYAGQPYGDLSCKSTLQSYRSSNLCP
jgi:hypothetical protein